MDFNLVRSVSVSGSVFAPKAINSEGWIPSQRTLEQTKLSSLLQKVDEPKLRKMTNIIKPGDGSIYPK